jgi:hypothetical protein
MKSKNREYDAFSRLATQLLNVPHSEVKAKLDAEKKEKARIKKRKMKRPD